MLTCKICNTSLVLSKTSEHYIAKDPTIIDTGLSAAISSSYTQPKQYDAFDCTCCGCQIIAQERKPKIQKDFDYFSTIQAVKSSRTTSRKDAYAALCEATGPIIPTK